MRSDGDPEPRRETPGINGRNEASADPIYGVIATAVDAERIHTAALAVLDEDDDAQMRRANAAADASSLAFQAVTATMPATLAGLHALAEFYAREAERLERSCMAGQYLRHLATALDERLIGAERIVETAAL